MTQNSQFQPDFPTSNPFSEHFAKFGKTRLFDRLQSKYTPKPYYYQYRTLRAVVLGASFLFHILSAATAFALIYLFVGKLIGNAIAAAAVTLAALVGLELSKRETSGRFFNDALQFGKISPGLLVAVLGLAAISTACSYFGADKAVRELTPPPTLVSADSLAAPISEQIAAIDGQISDAKKITWKGKITARAQRTIERLTTQRERLTAELIRIRERADGKNDATEKEHATTTDSNATGFALFTLACELLLLLCLWYLAFYDYRSYAEYCARPTGNKAEPGFTLLTPAAPAPSSNGNGYHHNTQGAHRRPIGFYKDNALRYTDAATNDPNALRYAVSGERLEVDRAAKPCAQCGTLFHPRTTWHRFCKEECKLAYHEAQHGERFDPAKKRKRGFRQ